MYYQVGSQNNPSKAIQVFSLNPECRDAFETTLINTFLQTEAWSSEYDIPQCDKVPYLIQIYQSNLYDNNINIIC